MSTKERIIETSMNLFLTKGYDSTSIQNILDEVGIGKGTLYHHFKNKEEILTVVISEMTDKYFENIERISRDENLDVYEKLVAVMDAVDVSGGEEREFIEEMHKPQNALFHEKSNEVLLRNLTPVMAEIINEGISKGYFSTPYPAQVSEFLIAYVMTFFLDIDREDIENIEKRIEAFIYITGVLLNDSSERLKKSIESIFTKEKI